MLMMEVDGIRFPIDAIERVKNRTFAFNQKIWKTLKDIIGCGANEIFGDPYTPSPCPVEYTFACENGRCHLWPPEGYEIKEEWHGFRKKCCYIVNSKTKKFEGGLFVKSEYKDQQLFRQTRGFKDQFYQKQGEMISYVPSAGNLDFFIYKDDTMIQSHPLENSWEFGFFFCVCRDSKGSYKQELTLDSCIFSSTLNTNYQIQSLIKRYTNGPYISYLYDREYPSIEISHQVLCPSIQRMQDENNPSRMGTIYCGRFTQEIRELKDGILEWILFVQLYTRTPSGYVCSERKWFPSFWFKILLRRKQRYFRRRQAWKCAALLSEFTNSYLHQDVCSIIAEYDANCYFTIRAFVSI